MVKNPYAENASQTLTGSQIEASVLEQAALKLRKVQKNWDTEGFDRFQQLDTAIQFNQKIWTVFQADVGKDTNKLPKEIRENLLSLSIFIRKNSLDIIADPKPEKLNTLIKINESLAGGLTAAKGAQQEA